MYVEFHFYSLDGSQQFDIIPASDRQLQYADGNLRPILITNENKNDRESVVPSKLLRPSGRLSHLNQNYTSEYQDQQLPGVGNLRDPLLERRIKHNRAATKIQAVYRGYTVRKSLHWLNQNQDQLNSEVNKRVYSFVYVYSVTILRFNFVFFIVN